MPMADHDLSANSGVPTKGHARQPSGFLVQLPLPKHASLHCPPLQETEATPLPLPWTLQPPPSQLIDPAHAIDPIA